jgi:dihydroflavonol-4-reductase
MADLSRIVGLAVGFCISFFFRARMLAFPPPSSDPFFWQGRTVCVTGGSGFLGYQTVLRLLEQGARVRTFGLPASDDHPLWQLPVQRLHGDIRDPAALRLALSGCDFIFHAAGGVATSGPGASQMRDVHVNGTRAVLRSMSRFSRLVHISSVVVIGAGRCGEMIDEASRSTIHPSGVDYVEAKRQAEEIALAAEHYDAVVVNPGYLMGPEDYEQSAMGRFCRRFWKGRIPLTLPGGFNLVDVRDAAAGCLLAAEHGQTGRRYILGGTNVSFSALLEALAHAAGMKPRWLLRAPIQLLWPLALFAEWLGKRIGRDPFPSRQELAISRLQWYYSSNRAERELGYRHRPLEETLRDAYAWHQGFELGTLRGLPRWWMRPASTSRAA